MVPPVTVSIFPQIAKPFFHMAIRWLPGASETVDGVLPTNAPSISISAPGGMDSMRKNA
jgi:hypothetical protein